MLTGIVHPLSSQQQLWCAIGPAAFGPRFVVAKSLRITGPVNVAALRGALDDVVARHEILRTVVVRDAQPPHQRVDPPAPVRLEVCDLPSAAGPAREALLDEHLGAAARRAVPVEEPPLLRAVLARFDDRDSVLTLLSHHTACDGWSINLILRDTAASYAARTGGPPRPLPPVRQYGEYARWQASATAGPAGARNMAYWHGRLDDAEIFSLPTDRPVRQAPEGRYTSCRVAVDADVTEGVTRLARSARGSRLMVVLAAMHVLAHRIRGTSAPVVNTMIHGRSQRAFRETVGPFLNFLALRVDLDDCASFRDVLARGRDACLAGYEHEVPITHVERDIPTLMAALAEPHNCDFIFGYFESPFAADAGNPFPFAEASHGVSASRQVVEGMPGGAALNLNLVPPGVITGDLQFDLDQFDGATVAGWVAEYVRILARAVAEPDHDWRTL